jgi:hypothetical protein
VVVSLLRRSPYGYRHRRVHATRVLAGPPVGDVEVAPTTQPSNVDSGGRADHAMLLLELQTG